MDARADELLLGRKSLDEGQLVRAVAEHKGPLRLVSVFECGLSLLPSSLSVRNDVEVLLANSNALIDVHDVLVAWPRLRRLYLAQNELRALPSSLKDLSLLERLDVARNRLQELAHLPSSLLRLDVHSNELSRLPEALPPLLQRLACHSNRPLRSLGALDALQGLSHLNVSFCPHLETLPRLPPSLEALRCEGCSLAGTLNVRGLRALRRVEARRNKLSGADVRECESLLALVLADNCLAQPPESVATLPLMTVDFSGNAELPKDIGIEAKTEEAMENWKHAVELRERLAQKQRELLELQSKIDGK